MKKSILTHIGCLFCLILHAGSTGVYDGRMTTSDELYWKGRHYYMNASPITCFSGFDSLYPQIPNPRGGLYAFYTEPLAYDKNYSVIWKIHDDLLYVSNLDFFTVSVYQCKDYFKPDENYGFTAIEKLTGKHFEPNNPAASVKPSSPYGVIPATWFSGKLYIKPYPDWDFTSFEEWLKMPVYELSFSSGRLTGVKELKGEMLTHPDHQELRRNVRP